MSGANWLAWREVLAEVLADFEVQENVSPAWLVNPETKRQLKLDLLYPEIGLAVRFRGAQPTARRRRASDQEVAADDRREEVRRELCRRHGVVLVTLDVNSTDPRAQLDRLHAALSRITRTVATSNLAAEEKIGRMDRLAAARRRLAELRERLRRPEDLALLADKWRDRETRALRAARRQQATPPPAPDVRYTPGMRVIHERFGEGQVVSVKDEPNGDQQVTVDFPTNGRRTFLASLVGSRMRKA